MAAKREGAYSQRYKALEQERWRRKQEEEKKKATKIQSLRQQSIKRQSKFQQKEERIKAEEERRRQQVLQERRERLRRNQENLARRTSSGQKRSGTSRSHGSSSSKKQSSSYNSFQQTGKSAGGKSTVDEFYALVMKDAEAAMQEPLAQPQSSSDASGGVCTAISNQQPQQLRHEDLQEHMRKQEIELQNHAYRASTNYQTQQHEISPHDSLEEPLPLNLEDSLEGRNNLFNKQRYSASDPAPANMEPNLADSLNGSADSLTMQPPHEANSTSNPNPNPNPNSGDHWNGFERMDSFMELEQRFEREDSFINHEQECLKNTLPRFGQPTQSAAHFSVTDSLDDENMNVLRDSLSDDAVTSDDRQKSNPAPLATLQPGHVASFDGRTRVAVRKEPVQNVIIQAAERQSSSSHEEAEEEPQPTGLDSIADSHNLSNVLTDNTVTQSAADTNNTGVSQKPSKPITKKVYHKSARQNNYSNNKHVIERTSDRHKRGAIPTKGGITLLTPEKPKTKVVFAADLQHEEVEVEEPSVEVPKALASSNRKEHKPLAQGQRRVATRIPTHFSARPPSKPQTAERKSLRRSLQPQSTRPSASRRQLRSGDLYMPFTSAFGEAPLDFDVDKSPTKDEIKWLWKVVRERLMRERLFGQMQRNDASKSRLRGESTVARAKAMEERYSVSRQNQQAMVPPKDPDEMSISMEEQRILSTLEQLNNHIKRKTSRKIEQVRRKPQPPVSGASYSRVRRASKFKKQPPELKKSVNSAEAALAAMAAANG